MTSKTVGAMQQSGYKNKTFLGWLSRADNLFFNRLCILTLCLGMTTSVFALCFSFLGQTAARYISAIPFCGFLIAFIFVDKKYALKLKVNFTGRAVRLFGVYAFFTACVTYAFLALLSFLSAWNGSFLYGVIAYVPACVLPMLLPFLFCAANATTGIFENARNRKFVKRAGQVLDETDIIRVGVVGSYGKTSVKNILKAMLSTRYKTVETPASYNTPIGVAKTVFGEEFAKKEVFIVEMGARKAGDIAELCSLVKPAYAVFTGVCEQHISTFESLDKVFAEKSEIIKSGAKVVCGESLKVRVRTAFGKNPQNVLFADGTAVENIRLNATDTQFTLRIKGESVEITTKLLGTAAVENIQLAATLAVEMGVSLQEIATAVSEMEAIPHRLQLVENGGVYILDDGYNANPRGAVEAIAALSRFSGRKCLVTPGIVECGVLEEKINAELGERIAKAGLDLVILVGETLVGVVKKGYIDGGGDESKLVCVPTLDKAKQTLSDWILVGDAVLFLNDLPDVY